MAQELPQASPGAAQSTLQAAAVALQQGRPQDAEQIARDVLTRNSGDIGAMVMLGQALLQQKRHADAIQPLEAAARQVRDSGIDTCLGVALRHAGRIDEALSRLKLAVNCQMPFPPAFIEYGDLLTQSAEYDEARDAFTRGLALLPNYPDLLAAAAGFFQLTCDFRKAIELYSRYLTIDPANSGARICVGICQLELGQRESAFQTFRAVTRANRNMVWKIMSALTKAGHGALWLNVKDAEAELL